MTRLHNYRTKTGEETQSCGFVAHVAPTPITTSGAAIIKPPSAGKQRLASNPIVNISQNTPQSADEGTLFPRPYGGGGSGAPSGGGGQIISGCVRIIGAGGIAGAAVPPKDLGLKFPERN